MFSYNHFEKIFYIDGQLYRSRYVSEIRFTGDYDYGYANIILNSGSSIHLPNKQSFIEFLFEKDWIEPCQDQ